VRTRYGGEHGGRCVGGVRWRVLVVESGSGEDVESGSGVLVGLLGVEVGLVGSAGRPGEAVAVSVEVSVEVLVDVSVALEDDVP
jgi:hypothetical protein